jgi:ketol-acid reductoisomerase
LKRARLLPEILSVSPLRFVKSAGMAKIYRDRDASLAPLRGKTCAVIGFGSQGAAWALNLRDSGARVVVGLPANSGSRRKARAAKFAVTTNAEVARQADVIVMAAPDLAQPRIFEQDLLPQLREGHAIVFLHGFCVHAKLILPPKNVDVVLVAPAGPGNALRSLFLDGRGLPGLLALHQDATGRAKKIALALAKAVGLTRAGVIETTVAEETEVDLFAEQAVLCGGSSALALAGYETLVAAGYQPELAYLACVYELRALAELIQRHGIHGMRQRISATALYGDLTRGSRVVGKPSRAAMRQVLEEIRSGKFAREWMRENARGLPRLKQMLKQSANHSMEKTGEALRALFVLPTGANPEPAGRKTNRLRQSWRAQNDVG